MYGSTPVLLIAFCLCARPAFDPAGGLIKGWAKPGIYFTSSAVFITPPTGEETTLPGA